MENNNNSQNFDSPTKLTTRNDAQSPTKLQQNQSEIMNSPLSPDKDKKPEKTKAEAVISFDKSLNIYFFLYNNRK